MKSFNKDKADFDFNNFQTILTLLKVSATEEEKDDETEELSRNLSLSRCICGYGRQYRLQWLRG